MNRTLDENEIQEVLAATRACIARAGRLFRHDFSPVPVSFDLRGRAAGVFQVKDGRPRIRYNPLVFARYFRENLDNTVPHEVAHYLVEVLHGHGKRGRGGARPHGVEWQDIMRALGAEPHRTSSFNLDGLPRRRYRYYRYDCQCGMHQLGSRRHEKVLRGQASYACKKCKRPLIEYREPA